MHINIDKLSQSNKIHLIDRLMKKNLDDKFLSKLFYKTMQVDNLLLFSHLFENYSTELNIDKKHQTNILHYIIDHQAMNIIVYFCNSPLYQVDEKDISFYTVLRAYSLVRPVFDLLVTHTPLFENNNFTRRILANCHTHEYNDINKLLVDLKVRQEFKCKLEKELELKQQQSNFKV